jgi:elongation factor P
VKQYLIEGQKYNVVFTDGTVAAVELPASISMLVTDAPDGVKGDSANNVYKAVTVETGLTVQVPLFIVTGERISVKTEDGSYLGRA